MPTKINPTGDTVLDSSDGALQAVRPTEPVGEAEPGYNWVEYKGLATERRISASDWDRAGISDAADSVWNVGNNFRVRADDFIEEQLQILRNDGSFLVPAAE